MSFAARPDSTEAIGRRFERMELVGKGGSGCVYRALDLTSGRIIALKILGTDGPRSLERFAQEAKVLAELIHPNVVRYVAHGATEEGEAYLAMEWLEGESLSRRLARGPLDLQGVIDLGLGVSRALAASHARGVVHRDIKPSNLFLVGGEPGAVRVLDFGLVHVAGASQMISRTSGIAGTPGYIAPEQARGEGEQVDARADVFSLGAVLFECLTGRRAFEGVHIMALLAQLILSEVPRVREIVPSVPAALDDLVARMLSKVPSERPANGAEVAQLLEDLAFSVPASMRALPPPSITSSEQRLLAVVAIMPARHDDADAATLRARSIACLRGARVDELASGTVLVTLATQGGATDQAATAARCALRLRAALPDASMALAMGHGEAAGRLPVGSVVDRAAELLALDPPAPNRPIVRIDEITRALLDERYEVRPEGASFVLAAEREIGDSARMLLGRPSPYVGRERELRMLTELVCTTFDGERGAQAVIVTAPAGMGKTRLRHELIRSLAAVRPEVMIGIGRADAMIAGSAFVVLGSALRNALGIPADEDPALTRSRLAERISHYVVSSELRRLTVFLSELMGIPAGSDGAPELAEKRSSGAKLIDEVMRAFVDVVRGMCLRRPVLLVLEDLQWADATSVRIVDHALRELFDRPLVVLALGRPEMADVFPDLWSKREVQSVRLGALARRAAEDLIAQSLGDALSSREVTRIVNQAAGNVFYLEELIRAVAEGRGDELPETVLGMVEARLSALPPGARRVLRAGSVFGEVFSKGGALALLGEGERAEASQSWLPLLVEREILVRRPSLHPGGEEEYAFRHALLREGSYAMLTPRDLVTGHHLAAEWLRDSGPAAPEARYAAIGEHLARAGELSLAARAFEQAGDAASQLHANAEARLHYLRALDALRRLPRSIDERRRLVDTLLKKAAVSYTDDPAKNLELLAEAEAIAAALPEAAQAPSDDFRRVARVHYWMGRTHWYRAEYPEAIGYFRRTLAAAQLLGDDELTALPSGIIGRVMLAQGHFGRKVPFLERSLGPLERTGNWTEWVVNAGFLGVAMSLDARAEEAIALGEKALLRAREIKSLTSTSIASTILGGIHVFLGREERAHELLLAATDAAEQAGDKLYSYLAYGFAAWAESRLGHPDEAARQMERARAITREIGRRLVFADWFDAFAVEAEERKGDVDATIAEAERVAPALEAAGSLLAFGIVHRAWGLALIARGPSSWDEAGLHLAESLRLLLAGEARVEAARTRIALAKLHHVRGEDAAFTRERDAALSVLQPIGAEREIERLFQRALPSSTRG